jgi:hypothetical protein
MVTPSNGGASAQSLLDRVPVNPVVSRSSQGIRALYGVHVDTDHREAKIHGPRVASDIERGATTPGRSVQCPDMSDIERDLDVRNPIENDEGC